MRLLTLLAAAIAAAGCSPKSGSTGSAVQDNRAYPPCHPGCFPAGTAIATPTGPKPIESLRAGDVVTLVGTDGVPKNGPVHSTFRTTNRPIEVRTDTGNIVTTTTQPLCLHGGGFRAAGELTEGDVIWRWSGSERSPARVLSIAPGGDEVAVFNLVVGEWSVFVAGGFLARGKPPLDANAPGSP